jgi:hypothetical protein
MRQRLFVWGAALLLPCLVSCGGGGGGSGLSGVLNVASFVIPAGETRTVTGDLVVNSVADLVIDGELRVTPGARVALYSDGDIQIRGLIGTAPGRKRITRQAQKPPANLVMSAKNVLITKGNNPVVLEPADVGAGIFITTWANTGKVQISQDLVTKPGKDSTTRSVAGGDAGHINIGNAFAIAEIKRDARGNAGTPRLVEITSTLTTGRGGEGFTDYTGVEQNGTLVVANTSGGAGGIVDINSSQETPLNISREKVILGRGGHAGNCGTAGEPIRARSGTAAGEAGQSVVVDLSTEGLGGVLFLKGTSTDHHAEHGLTGNVYVAAGNGGPGGKGGDTTVEVDVGTLLEPEASKITLEDGGNGGTSTQQFKNGGLGGNVTITVRGRQAAPELHTVMVNNYGNGGAGLSGCTATPPGPGTSGGRGGTLTVPLSVAHTVQNSFRGGNAANGDPPGAKGAGGTLSKDGSRYPEGDAGAPCSAASEIKFSETEVSLFTNDEKPVTLTRFGPLAQVNKDIQVTVRSEDGRVVIIRNLANNTLAKSHTITWPKGQASLNLNIVGGLFIGDDPDIVAQIVDSEFSSIQTRLEVINGQRLTTVEEITLTNLVKIPAGTVLTYLPDVSSRIKSMGFSPPNSGCSSWHGVGGTSGRFLVDDQVAFGTENPCGYGTVIQPIGPTDP